MDGALKLTCEGMLTITPPSVRANICMPMIKKKKVSGPFSIQVYFQIRNWLISNLKYIALPQNYLDQLKKFFS